MVGGDRAWGKDTLAMNLKRTMLRYIWRPALVATATV